MKKINELKYRMLNSNPYMTHSVSGTPGDELVPLKDLAEEYHDDPSKRQPPSPRFRSQSLFDFDEKEMHPRIQITEPDGAEETYTNIYSSSIAMTFPKSFKRSDRKVRRLNTQLLHAIKNTNIPEVRRLLDIGANPNAFCHLDYVSACHLAALTGGESLALLIKAGAEKFRRDKLGQTPVHLAAWAGNSKQIAILLDLPDDLQDRVEHEITKETEEAIKRYCVEINEMTNMRCDLDMVEKSLPRNWADNIDHHCRDIDGSIPFFQPGWSPLHAASAHARPNCVRLLLAAGADPNIRDYLGRTPLDVVGFALYSERDINEKHFTETIRVLINGGSTQTCIRNRVSDSPLHTAVDLGSLESMQLLMDLGAATVCLNRAGLTPLHVCVKKKLKEHLQFLANYDYKDLDRKVATVDVRDKDGYTVLHSAVMASWAPGVCVALEAGANVTAKGNDGETPIHSAAAIGDTNILNEILSVIKQKDIIDQRNIKEETPLFKAIIHGHLECVQRILEHGASIEKTLPKNVNVFHIAAELGNYKILKVLLDHDYTVTRAMIYLTDDRKGFGPIHFAVLNNHPDCVKLLLSSNAYVSLKCSCGPHKSETPLHMAAATNNIEITKIIIKFDKTTVHNVDARGWTPLHTASQNGSRDVISLILDKGGDLSLITTKTSKTAINMIMSNLSKPTEFMDDIFDSYITSNGQNFQDPTSEITVNYDILIPSSHNNEQMKVIQALLETGNRYDQRRLLLHPLIESFLYLKWNALLPFFYTLVGLYGVFVLSLTIFLVSIFFYKDTERPVPMGLDASYWKYVIYISVTLLVIQELFLMNLSKNHFFQLETLIKLICIVLALILPSAVTYASNEDWPRHVATITLLLAWLEMMFLLSRFPKWGYYVLMFGKVSSNVIKFLANYDCKDLDQKVATVDVRDKDGYTVLHSAVMASWAPGVCVALEAGANVTAKGNDGETPIHSAAAIGDRNILNEILSVVKQKDIIDQRNIKEETPLFKAIIHGHLECVQRILEHGASIEKTLPKNVNVFHIAAELGNYKILKVLLDHDYTITRAMIYLTDDRKGFGPIHFAVLNNHPDCVKLLLSSNAYVSLKCSCGPHKSETPLHMAAATNNIEITKIIIKFDKTTVHNVDARGWTPLHTASQNGSRDVISLILDKGGDLSLITTKTSKTAINMIMSNLSKPTEFMDDIFDSYITSNGQNFQDPTSEITVNYDILIPSSHNNEQMKVIQALLETGNRYDQRRLLLHPLIESFLYLKWNALLPFFYTLVGLYGVFVLSLTIFLVSIFFYKDTERPVPMGLDASYWKYVIYISVTLLVIQELFLMNLSKNHFFQLETLIKLICIVLALILPSAVTYASNEDWPRHVATITLLLAWLEMMFLLSRFPKWGYYVLMFGKVSSNVIKILLTFAFLLIGFSLSFMVQFHSQTPFDGPWAALVKTMVMMTSEFNYDDLLKHSNTSYVVIRIIFFVFLILAAIVLMNLMVGVAVNDLSNLEIIGNIKRLEKQVEFLASLETLVYNRLFNKILPRRLKASIKYDNKVKMIILKPSEPKSDYYQIFPIHIREAIFVKAQKKDTCMNESQTLNLTMNKIYDLVLKSYELRHSEGIDLVKQSGPSVCNQDEISEVRSLIATQVQELKKPILALSEKMDLILRRLDRIENK